VDDSEVKAALDLGGTNLPRALKGKVATFTSVVPTFGMAAEAEVVDVFTENLKSLYRTSTEGI